MKFLIWFGVYSAPIYVITICRINGIYLGFIPVVLLYSVAFFVSDFLCDKWDVKAFEKEAKKHGKTPGAYAQDIFPPSLMELCAANKNDKTEFKKILTQNVKAGAINKAHKNVLLYMFDIGAFH